MSRSRAKRYRTFWTDGFFKNYANRVVRRNRFFDICGKAYKKLFNSWDINDGARAKPIPDDAEEWAEKAKRK